MGFRAATSLSASLSLLLDLSRLVVYGSRGCSAFGACDLAASCLLLADGALFGRGLAAAADDGVVVVAVGLGSVATGGVVGVALCVFLGCARPAVAVAPERHPVDLAESLLSAAALVGELFLPPFGATRAHVVQSERNPYSAIGGNGLVRGRLWLKKLLMPGPSEPEFRAWRSRRAASQRRPRLPAGQGRPHEQLPQRTG